MEKTISAGRLPGRKAGRDVDPERLASQRAFRWLLAAEAALVSADGPDPTQWTSERRHRMELAQRYKNSAERSFHKAWSVLQGLRKDIMRVDDQKAKLQLQIDIFKLNEAREKADRRREKRWEEDASKPPKVVVIHQKDLHGEGVRKEYQNGKLVDQKEILVT